MSTLKKRTTTLLEIARKNERELQKNVKIADKALDEFLRKHKKAFKVLASY